MAAKLRSSSAKKPRGKGRPFAKGADPRRNLKGRIMPKDQRELNDLLDEIFAETVTDEKGRQMEKLRVALNRLLFSKNVAGVIHLLERRYGKVPQPIVGGGADDEPITHKVIVEHVSIQNTDTGAASGATGDQGEPPQV